MDGMTCGWYLHMEEGNTGEGEGGNDVLMGHMTMLSL
jgi:hypothetical protein